MTFRPTLNGYSVEVFRVPLGETGEKRWDILNDGLSEGEAMYQFNYLRNTFKDHDIRVRENYMSSRLVAEVLNEA